MIKKSEGVTSSEKFLGELCENTFLKAWSFPNPYNKDKKEFCDLIAVFNNNMFIFFDRIRKFHTNDSKEISWERWKKEVILKQIRTSIGAEKYIRKNGELFLDANAKNKFPITYNPSTVRIYKIIIANGAEEACKSDSDLNLNGSLGIIYSDRNHIPEKGYPFTIHLEKENPIHVFDSFNLPIILSELDTFYDFCEYLNAKEIAISKFDNLSYCGEEDLLAYYLHNYDKETKSHYICHPTEKFDSLMITEGHWSDYFKSEVYKRKKNEEKISYIWDGFIQHSSNFALLGTLEGNSDIFQGNGAIFEMAKEPRFFRSALSRKIFDSIQKFPTTNPFMRHLTFMPSFFEKKGYVFLQIAVEKKEEKHPDYRRAKQYMLEIACGVTKNEFPYLEKIIGIAIEPPLLYEKITEDFILLNCNLWSEEDIEHYNTENTKLGLDFYKTSNLKKTNALIKEFPDLS